jgi:hypothetical protein
MKLEDHALQYHGKQKTNEFAKLLAQSDAFVQVVEISAEYPSFHHRFNCLSDDPGMKKAQVSSRWSEDQMSVCKNNETLVKLNTNLRNSRSIDRAQRASPVRFLQTPRA